MCRYCVGLAFRCTYAIIVYSKRGSYKNAPNVNERTKKMCWITIKDKEKNIFTVEEEDLFDAWNEHCENCNNTDDEIFYNNDDFLDLFTRRDVANRIAWGNYNPYHDFVALNGYGNFITSDNILELIDLNDCEEFVDSLKKYRVA